MDQIWKFIVYCTLGFAMQRAVCSKFLRRRAQSITKCHIPQLLFRTSEETMDALHPKFRDMFNITLIENPTYQQVYFDGNDRLKFIFQYFPEFVDGYKSILPGAYKSDIWRLLVLYKFGGVYADMGMKFVVHLDNIIRPTDNFVAAVDLDPTAVLNGFLGVEACHPIVKTMIEHVMENIQFKRYNCNNLDITGPKALGRAYNSFFDHRRPTAITTGVHTIGNSNYRFLQFNKNNAIYENNNVIIRNKFDGYKEIIYKNNTHSFGVVYWLKKVYEHEQDSYSGAHIHKSAGVFHEGSLVQAGREFWYVMNGSRHGFPDYDTFCDMGFESCMTSRHSNHAVTNLPLADPFSTNISANLRLMHGYLQREASGLNLESCARAAVPEKFAEKMSMLRTKHGASTVTATEFLSVVME